MIKLSYLTVNEVALRLSVSKSRVYAMVRSGELPAYRIGVSIRFDPDELARFLHERKTNVGSAASKQRADQLPNQVRLRHLRQRSR